MADSDAITDPAEPDLSMLASPWRSRLADKNLDRSHFCLFTF